MKLNGVELIPSSLVACKINDVEVRIVELSYEGFSFRISDELTNIEKIDLYFYEYDQNEYKHFVITKWTQDVQEESFYWLYTIMLDESQYKSYVGKIMKDYTNYIYLKLSEDDAYLSEEMTGMSSEGWEDYFSSFEEQKREWISGYLEHETFEVILEQMEYEFAISIDNPKRYEQFLKQNLNQYQKSWLMENGLEEHPLFRKKATRIYIGNQFCHNLLPTKEQIKLLLEKAKKEEISVTLVYTYIRDEFVEDMEEQIVDIEKWCKINNEKLEVVVNDWGMIKLFKGKEDVFSLNLGVLLNKRRKDPRMKYKNGILNQESLWRENSFSSLEYQNFLKENWNIERYEIESCGYMIATPKGKTSLHLPYFQTNTSQYCTLYAKSQYGDRSNQRLVRGCVRCCENQVFLYPKQFQMVGVYNSLFGFDIGVLKDAKIVKEYLREGVDRIVLNLL